MYRAVIVALASALLILPATELLARGGGGGHGGGGGGGGPSGGFSGGFAGGRAGFAGGSMGGFGGGRAGLAGGHMGRMHAGPGGPVGFRARANVNRANVNRHVVANRFRHRKVFFIGGYGGEYYYSCYPIWNGYRWVNSCNWGNYGY